MLTTTFVIILVALAAIFKAVADTLTHHFSISIFKDRNKLFFDPIVSWRNKYVNGDPKRGKKKSFTVRIWKLKFKIPANDSYSDAWHIANGLMLLCFIGALSISRPHTFLFLELPVGGGLFMVAFNLFYNKILIKKK